MCAPLLSPAAGFSLSVCCRASPFQVTVLSTNGMPQALCHPSFPVLHNPVINPQNNFFIAQYEPVTRLILPQN